MQQEQNDLHNDDLAEIWRGAQRRRSEDINLWFTHFFERQRQRNSSESRPQYSSNGSLVWKFLKAIHVVSPTTN